MCVGIEYFLNGSPTTVYFDGAERAQLPVRLRGGKIAWYTWGARGGMYSDDNTPGWLQKFPESSYASLADIRADKWTKFAPKPARIAAARFIQINSFRIGCYFALSPGQYIQGLIATISAHKPRTGASTLSSSLRRQSTPSSGRNGEDCQQPKAFIVPRINEKRPERSSSIPKADCAEVTGYVKMRSARLTSA